MTIFKEKGKIVEGIRENKMEKQRMEKKMNNKQSTCEKIHNVFSNFESMLDFFKDKTAEYELKMGDCCFRLCIYRTKNGLELTRSDGYRAAVIGYDNMGRLLVKNEMLIYRGLDGKAAYKSVHGMLRGVTFTDVIVTNGRIEKLGITNHGFTSEKIPAVIYLAVRRRRRGCYIATCVYHAYDCPKVWTLRRFRDNILAKTWYGRMFIRIYYAVSPALVRCFGKKQWFLKLFRDFLDRIITYLNQRGIGDNFYSGE